MKLQKFEQGKWPFTIRETQELLKIERYKATFNPAQIARTIVKQLVSAVEIPEKLELFYKKFQEENPTKGMKEIITILDLCYEDSPSPSDTIFDTLDECCDTDDKRSWMCSSTYKSSDTSCQFRDGLRWMHLI